MTSTKPLNSQKGPSVKTGPVTSETDEERDQRNAHHSQVLEQLEHADERADHRDAEQGPPRWRQPGGERDEEQPASYEEPAVPGEPAEGRGVDAAGEVVVGLARVAGEQPLEVVRGQVLRCRCARTDARRGGVASPCSLG